MGPVLKEIRGLAIIAILCAASGASAQFQETRYCGPPKRNVAGDIIRRADVLTAFRQQHVCPVTGTAAAKCPGWAIDHVIPLACGGCDAVHNLQWLPLTIKSTPADSSKDRWERYVYANPAVYVTNYCFKKTIVIPPS